MDILHILTDEQIQEIVDYCKAHNCDLRVALHTAQRDGVPYYKQLAAT